MDSIVITEKTSQAEDIKKAVGNTFGSVLPAQGHLLELEEPEDTNPDWKEWGYDVLRPAPGFYNTRVPRGQANGQRVKLRAIRDGLKSANRVIIATDCDREGQVIGQELLEHFGFEGEVLRAIFTAQDETTLKASFAALKPNLEFENMFRAGWARRQADQIYNLTLTRAATKAFHSGRGALGVGRVKTPTLAIVCMREEEILNFKAQDYFEILARGRQADMLIDVEFRHDPAAGKDGVKLLDRPRAEAMAASAEGFEGPLAVKTEAKRGGPPALLDLPGLQKICSSRFGWTADKTLEIAQSLYDGDGRKIITYPRAEAKYLAESQVADVPAIVGGLRTLSEFSHLSINEPVIRQGKSGVFSDKALEGVSHHAIIPNVNTMDRVAAIHPKLSADERKMFDLVARHYLAAVMPDWLYDRTEAVVDVPHEGRLLAFKASGNVTTQAGWKEALPNTVEDAKNPPLPKLTDGVPVRLTSANVDAKRTKAPPRYSEGALIDAMQNAWRFVPEGPRRDRLMEAKGIGTPATRAEVIKGLKNQRQIEAAGKFLAPTEIGMGIFRLFRDKAPALVDPGVTAEWELRLDAVSLGEVEAQRIVDEIADAAGGLVKVLKAAEGSFGSSAQGPTPKMAKLARTIAARRGLTLPEEVKTSFRACQAFLDKQMQAALPPTDKQVMWVETLAAEKGVEPPEGWREDGRIASKFLDEHFEHKGGGAKGGQKNGRTKRRRRK